MLPPEAGGSLLQTTGSATSQHGPACSCILKPLPCLLDSWVTERKVPYEQSLSVQTDMEYTLDNRLFPGYDAAAPGGGVDLQPALVIDTAALNARRQQQQQQQQQAAAAAHHAAAAAASAVAPQKRMLPTRAARYATRQQTAAASSSATSAVVASQSSAMAGRTTYNTRSSAAAAAGRGPHLQPQQRINSTQQQQQMHPAFRPTLAAAALPHHHQYSHHLRVSQLSHQQQVLAGAELQAAQPPVQHHPSVSHPGTATTDADLMALIASLDTSSVDQQHPSSNYTLDVDWLIQAPNTTNTQQQLGGHQQSSLQQQMAPQAPTNGPAALQVSTSSLLQHQQTMSHPALQVLQHQNNRRPTTNTTTSSRMPSFSSSTNNNMTGSDPMAEYQRQFYPGASWAGAAPTPGGAAQHHRALALGPPHAHLGGGNTNGGGIIGCSTSMAATSQSVMSGTVSSAASGLYRHLQSAVGTPAQNLSSGLIHHLPAQLHNNTQLSHHQHQHLPPSVHHNLNIPASQQHPQPAPMIRTRGSTKRRRPVANSPCEGTTLPIVIDLTGSSPPMTQGPMAKRGRWTTDWDRPFPALSMVHAPSPLHNRAY